MRKPSVITAVISPDKHFAHAVNGVKPMDRHDPAALSILLQIMNEIKPDIYIDLGDMVHLAYLSHWNQGRDLWGKSVSEDGETVPMLLKDDNALIGVWLDHVMKACRKDTKYYQLEGNHEEIMRVSRNMNKYAPLVNNSWYPEKAWDLAERKMEFIPYQRYGPNGKNYVQLGKYLKVIHGHYASTNHLAKHWLHWQTNLIYGHMHTIESKAFPNLHNHTNVQTIGCLCTPTASYHRGRNNAWGQAFSVVYLMPDGQFHDVLVRIINGKAIWNGKIYYAKSIKGIE
jgi:hypothetical protein